MNDLAESIWNIELVCGEVKIAINENSDRIPETLYNLGRAIISFANELVLYGKEINATTNRESH